MVAPGGNIPVAARLTVPRTRVPASGPLTVHATGATPGLSFHRPGHATITFDNHLDLHFTPRDASGNPTAAGKVDFSCTVDPGQSTVVYSFDITPPPASSPTTGTTKPPASPTVNAPQTSTAPPGATSSTATSATTSSSAATSATTSPTETTLVAPTATGTTGDRPLSTLAGFENVIEHGAGWLLTAAAILAAVAGVIGGVWRLTRRRVPRR